MTEQHAKLRLALRAHAAELTTEATPPPAHAVWLRARHRERQHALQRSALPLRAMYGIATIAAILMCAWVLHATGPTAHNTLSHATLLSSTPKWLFAAFIATLAGWALLFRASQRLFTS